MYHKQNISLVRISIHLLIFKIQGITWDLSMMRTSYMLTKRIRKLKKLKNPENVKYHKPLTIKTATNTGKIKKLCRKVRDESVEAI